MREHAAPDDAKEDDAASLRERGCAGKEVLVERVGGALRDVAGAPEERFLFGPWRVCITVRFVSTTEQAITDL